MTRFIALPTTIDKELAMDK